MSILQHTITKKTVIVLIIIGGVYSIYTNIEFNQRSIETPKPIRFLPGVTKTILYWDTVYGAEDFGLGLGEIFENCPVQSCITTHNKSYLPINKFDAILFHGARFSIEKDGLPTNRSAHQKYIFYSTESYFNTYFEAKTNNNFYNWTMTYKRDSDIYWPYGRIIRKVTHYIPPTKGSLRSRKKKVAWFVSNCWSPGTKRRTRYVQALQKYIPVDIYGNCGTLKCPQSEECFKMLETNYKFYLSFENSFCEDYVTEKVFNILKYNVIPIVFSFIDYDALFPQQSLINANHFINPKHLADYLWRLDQNDTEYLEYFEWKKQYIVDDTKHLCDLCKKLHEPLVYSTYANIKDWYFGYSCVS